MEEAFVAIRASAVSGAFAMASISKLSRTLAALRIEAEMADAHALKLQRRASEDSCSSVSSDLLQMAAEETDKAEQIRQRIRGMSI
jgi:hypothetical protein